MEEIVFSHQNKKQVSSSALNKLYTVTYYFRWYLTIFMVVTWNDKPRTIMSLVVVLDILLIVYAALICKTFNKISSILILTSEGFLLFRHISHLAIVID